MATPTVSYAQRFEDLYLMRCFASDSDGFYIDIGSGHPVYDNTSFALRKPLLSRSQPSRICAGSMHRPRSIFGIMTPVDVNEKSATIEVLRAATSGRTLP